MRRSSTADTLPERQVSPQNGPLRLLAPTQASFLPPAQATASPLQAAAEVLLRLKPLATLIASLSQFAAAALAILLLITALAPARTVANEVPDEVPDPLSLEQALSFAETHPRVTAERASAVSAFTLPRTQPLYLGCHSLAFSGARGNDAERDVAWSALLSSADAQRLEITQRFYDVLLADLSFARDNEAMAVAFIQFDRAEAREALGQFSPLRTAELQADYQLIRRQRAASEAAQRVTRALLVTAMGHPTSLPRQLITPELDTSTPESMELDAVVNAAIEHNPKVKTLMQGRSDAEQSLVRMAVRERALELLTRLQLLQVIAEQARSESDWRDLKLDESRTMYELEAKADLGFSMSQQTKARRDEQETAFCRALTRAELNALQGQKP